VLLLVLVVSALIARILSPLEAGLLHVLTVLTGAGRAA
jgi:hypothetical protein